MLKSITQDDLAELNRLAALARRAKVELDGAIDKAERLLEVEGADRDSIIADAFCSDGDVKRALRLMGVVTLRMKSRKAGSQ